MWYTGIPTLGSPLEYIHVPLTLYLGILLGITPPGILSLFIVYLGRPTCTASILGYTSRYNTPKYSVYFW